MRGLPAILVLVPVMRAPLLRSLQKDQDQCGACDSCIPLPRRGVATVVLKHKRQGRVAPLDKARRLATTLFFFKLYPAASSLLFRLRAPWLSDVRRDA